MNINRLCSISLFIVKGLISATILIYLSSIPIFAQISTPDYCDTDPDSTSSVCIYGQVYYHNRPVSHAKIKITVNGERGETYTQFGENRTIYAIPSTAIDEVIHITAEFAGETAHRSIRIRPDEAGQQEFNLIIPPTTIWDLWNIRNNIHELEATQDGSTMVAASESGVLWLPESTIPNVTINHILATMNDVSAVSSLNDSEDESHTYQNDSVYDIALDAEDRIWTITEEGLFSQNEKDGTDWLQHDLPIDTPLHAILIDQENEVVWVGGGSHEQGELAMYKDAEWSQIYTTQAAIHTLALDYQNNLWVGTWGDGVYQYNGQEEWIHYTTAEGLASDYIHTILATVQSSDTKTIWFGTAPMKTTEQRENYVQGGISVYNVADQTWQTYTTEHGLPAHEEQADAAANIYTLAITYDNIVWAGTDHGLYILGNNTPGNERWVRHDPEIDGRVNALALFNGQLVVATTEGLKVLQSMYIDTQSIYGALTANIAKDGLLELAVTPVHHDRPVANIDVTWSWISASYGLLCTTPDVCTYPMDHLPPGTHQITLYTQNPTGHKTKSTTLDILIPYHTYLPTIQR